MDEDSEISQEESVIARYVDGVWLDLALNDEDPLDKSDFEELVKLGVAVAVRQQDQR